MHYLFILFKTAKYTACIYACIISTNQANGFIFPQNEWVSMGVVSDGSYGIPEGIVYSFPVKINNGEWTIVQGLTISDFSREKMDATAKELLQEKDAVASTLEG